jgi:hypothetical protein
MKDNVTANAVTKRIAFLNCFDAKLFVADVEMSEADDIQFSSALEWLYEAGIILLPATDLTPGPIGAVDVMHHLRATVGDLLVDAALGADPTRPAGTAVQPAAVMPVWPFEAEGDDPDDRDVLLSSGRLWGMDVLLEALRVDGPDHPAPVPAVRPRFERWVKAAGGGTPRAAIHPPGEAGCYFLAGVASPA